MFPRASDLMDSTVYSINVNDDSAFSETRPSQQSASSESRDPQLRFQAQYFPPTQYSPELSDLDSEQGCCGSNSTHGRPRNDEIQGIFPGSFPDESHEQPRVGRPSFNSSLKHGIVGTAPAHPSQTSFSTPIKQRLSTSRFPDDERRLKAEELLPLLQKELSSDRNISQTSSFVDLLFPPSRLPFPINDTTLKTLAKDGFWNEEDACFTVKFKNYRESTIAQCCWEIDRYTTWQETHPPLVQWHLRSLT